VTVAGTTVTFSSRVEQSSCVLTVDVSDAVEPSGHELMRDVEESKIVRVKRNGEEVSLRLDNGEILHVSAVTNEDGCRVATRIEREHSGGSSSFVDRVLGRTRGK
jgi:tartrate dehydratase beta subunit/fumarate hydratase class I family protein